MHCTKKVRSKLRTMFTGRTPVRSTLLMAICGAALTLHSCKDKELADVAPPEKPGVSDSTAQGGTLKKGFLFGAPITYREVNGRAIWQGDILLSPEQLSGGPSNSPGGRTQSAAISPLNYRWPDNKVPYVIDNLLSGAARETIEFAIKNIENATNLDFVNRTASQPDYISFRAGVKDSDAAGFSSLGRVGGRQLITLKVSPPFNAVDVGTVYHEMFHALGLIHEHQRADRDNHVNVALSNVKSEFRYAFEKYTDAGINGFDHSTFDFNSVMLYDSYAFAIDASKPTITKKDGSVFPEASIPSQKDYACINDMYPKPAQKLSGMARDIGVGANGAVYVISNEPKAGGFRIYRREGTGWWPVDGPGGGVAIDVKPDGTPWMVNDKNEVWTTTTADATSWFKVPFNTAKDIGVGADGSVFIISTTTAPNGGFKVFKQSGFSWAEVPGRGGFSIDVDPSGRPWITGVGGQVYQHTGNQWTPRGGSMMDITVAADGAVYAIGNVALGNDLYKWTGSSWMPQTAGHKSKVSAGKNGEVWWVERVDSDGSQYQIYRRPGN